MLVSQPVDVNQTRANSEGLFKDYNYSPKTKFKYGVNKFTTWFKSYYKNV